MRLRRMKVFTIFLGIALSVLFTTGCKFGDWLLTDTGSMVVKEAGELAGLVTGFEKVEDIDKLIAKCDSLLLEKNEALKELAIQEAYSLIYAKYGHNPQTAYLMSKATTLIGIVLKEGKLEFLAGYNPVWMDDFIVAFRNGLSLATPRHGRFIRR